MGRKGMKGFLKGVHHKAGPEEDDHSEQQPSTTSTASAPKAAAPAAPAPATKATQPTKSQQPTSDEDESDGEGGSGKGETRGKMLQRHKKEMQAFKKQLQRMGKKSKDDLAKMTAEIEARHAQELKDLEQQESTSSAPAPAAEAVAAVAQLAISAEPEHQKKPSKAQKRREKLAAQEAEREARIAAEQATTGTSEKQLEEEQLAHLLAPHKLQIREVRADGHCMYRALEHQLQKAGTSTSSSYLQLRKLAAEYIQQHPDDFVPFLMDEEFESDDTDAELLKYCQKVAETAAWGGQVELGALAHALRRQIKVYAVGMPVLTLGDEYSGGGEVLEVCYLRHAFGLGEHYNSVEPLAQAEEEEEGQQQQQQQQQEGS